MVQHHRDKFINTLRDTLELHSSKLLIHLLTCLEKSNGPFEAKHSPRIAMESQCASFIILLIQEIIEILTRVIMPTGGHT